MCAGSATSLGSLSKMKTYPITCPSCNGTGLKQVAVHYGTTAMTEPCPACGGNKWVMCCDKRDDEAWPIMPMQYKVIKVESPNAKLTNRTVENLKP